MSNNLHLVTGYAGEEHVTSADMGSYNAAMIGNGEYVLERGNKFAASIISNNKVKVLDGDLMMQGRHVRLNENTYVELDFENGTQGYKRNDLIVARYTKDNTTGVESCNLVVIKGTPSTSAASDPAYTTGDIINDHVSVNDMPLYRVPFDGINMQSLVPLFSTMLTFELLKKSVSDGKAKVADAITDKGIETATNASFETLADNIRNIVINEAQGTALNRDVLIGKTFSSNNGTNIPGTMPNRANEVVSEGKLNSKTIDKIYINPVEEGYYDATSKISVSKSDISELLDVSNKFGFANNSFEATKGKVYLVFLSATCKDNSLATPEWTGCQQMDSFCNYNIQSKINTNAYILYATATEITYVGANTSRCDILYCELEKGELYKLY